MTKMSRREYLLQMGAGAAAVAGMARDILARPQNRRRARRAVRKTQKSANKTSAAASGLLQFTNWPSTDVTPSLDSPVVLIFGGLFGFFYNGACDIRYHPGNRHHPMIRIWRSGNDLPEDISPLPSKCKRMIVEINRPQSNVKFYEEFPERPFVNRDNDMSMDFRWLLDLDSEDFYVNKNFALADKFNRTLKVRHGTFFTALTTCSTFTRVNIDDHDSHPISMGRMPLFMGAALNPNPNEYVSLLFQELKSNQFVTYDTRTFRPADGNVQVQFLNHCDSAYGCPKPNPHSSNDDERNDFHFVRNALNLKNVPVYGIKINAECGEDKRKRWYDGVHALGLHPLNQFISDNAPCMGAGFGGR